MGLNLKGKVNGVVAGVATKIGIAWALGQVRAAAEGRLGPEWKARYWWLAGKKRWTGLAFAAAAVAVAALGYTEASAVLGSVSGVALAAGFLDQAWRTEIPEELRSSALYRFLASHSALLTTAFSSLFVLVQAGECGGLDCNVASAILVGLAAIAGLLGLVDSAWKSAPPVLRRLDGRWQIQLPGNFFGLIIGDTRAEALSGWHDRQAAGKDS